jgi:hypothetical protein
MVDMGIEIKIKLDELLPQGPDGYSERQWTVAEIDYGSGEIGYLIFIKSALTEETPVNLRQFRSTDPKFPQTPSSDQFFTEAQFEAYRELGWFIGNDMLSSDDEFVEGMLDQLVRDGAVPTGPVPPEVESATNSDGTKKFGASA